MEMGSRNSRRGPAPPSGTRCAGGSRPGFSLPEAPRAPCSARGCARIGFHIGAQEAAGSLPPRAFSFLKSTDLVRIPSIVRASGVRRAAGDSDPHGARAAQTLPCPPGNRRLSCWDSTEHGPSSFILDQVRPLSSTRSLAQLQRCVRHGDGTRSAPRCHGCDTSGTLCAAKQLSSFAPNFTEY